MKVNFQISKLVPAGGGHRGVKMKIGAYVGAMQSVEQSGGQRGVGRFGDRNYSDTNEIDRTSAIWNSRLQDLNDVGREEEKNETSDEEEPQDRPEAVKIYEAVNAGRNPWEDLRKPPKYPYEHMAKDGVIEYNGVIFVCDERSNSICLGDMTDEKNVLNIPLSGGGHLKVNRNSIGLLSKAAGMFTPEDLNLIMRAISLDTKLQQTEKEIEDTEASVGNQLRGDERAAEEETESE